MSEPTEVTVDNIEEAIEFMEKRQKETAEQIDLFSKNFRELTGYDPSYKVNAFDVVKIMHTFQAALKSND